jgi:P27 family predicted phage terminase small subunit
MGRPAKTIRQHLLHGSVPQGKPEKASVYSGGRPKIPSHLSPAARTEFKRACKILLDRGTSTPGDFVTLAVYSEVYARWIQAKQEIGDELMIETAVTDNNGTLRTVRRLNPLLKVAEACESRMLNLAKALGLTPMDREKVKQAAVNADEEIVPGSIAHLHPELLNGKVTEIKPVQLSDDELAAALCEDEPDADADSTL